MGVSKRSPIQERKEFKREKDFTVNRLEIQY